MRMRVFIFFLPRCDAAFFIKIRLFFHMFVDEHMFIYIMSMRLATLFFLSVNLVMRWNGHVFFLIH